MGRRGPPPQPTVLKVLRGNPGKRPLPENEPKPRPIAPKPPAWLDPEARKEWKRVAPELERLGLLTCVDGAALETYCQHYAIMVRALKELKQHVKEHGTIMVTYTNKAGAENVVPHPAIKVANEAAKVMRAFALEFGLTPSARARMALPGKRDEVDEFEEYLRHGKVRSG